MAVTSHLYPNIVHAMGTAAGSLNLTTNSFTAGLCTSAAATWGSTQQAYLYVSSLTGAYTEVSTGGGYTSGYAGRQALTTLTFSNDSPAGVCVWTCTSPAPISFGATTTITAASMFINNKTANSSSSDSNSWAMVIIDFNGNVISTAGAFTYTVDGTNGLAAFTSS